MIENQQHVTTMIVLRVVDQLRGSRGVSLCIEMKVSVIGEAFHILRGCVLGREQEHSRWDRYFAHLVLRVEKFDISINVFTLGDSMRWQ